MVDENKVIECEVLVDDASFKAGKFGEKIKLTLGAAKQFERFAYVRILDKEISEANLAEEKKAIEMKKAEKEEKEKILSMRKEDKKEEQENEDIEEEEEKEDGKKGKKAGKKNR